MSEEPEFDNRIAIVGMAGRFPGAADVRAFWTNLLAGQESVRFFRDNELEDTYDKATRAAPNFVRARPILDGIDQFDAEFFRMQPREAALTDPQQRIFLECAWEALEDSGYDSRRYPGVIGVFGGASLNTYFLRNVCGNRETLDRFTNTFQVDDYDKLLGAAPDFLATRVGYKLDLQGPAMTVQTACSTSLVAVAQACQALLLGQTDMMLAGGVSITVPQRRGFLHQEGGMVSADGHCRPFDADASGTIFGDGAGVVVLKRLADAIADRDHVYAVILSYGLSNDGSGKVGFTAPGIAGQVAAIEQALAQAAISARDVSYVECHGTATPLGDPIEVAALTQAFRRSTDDVGFCALGSVKSNIGHLETAAGVVGLIKVALMLRHRTIVPTLHFKAPNPQIAFQGGPFTVADTKRAWVAEPGPLRAGVSSLGVGGTNAHILLEEAPLVTPRRDTAPEPSLLTLSARTPAALASMRRRLADRLAADPETDLGDVAFTLQQGRREFAHRCAIVASDRTQAIRALGEEGSGATVGQAPGEAPPIAFLCPGQGSQYVGMGRALYQRWAAFRAALDDCARALRGYEIDLLDALFGEAGEAATERLAMTGLAQPAIFSVSYALAELWRSWGVTPTAAVGHSLGELVVACLAGVLSLEDALGFVAARGRLIQALPPGGMITVRLSEAEIAPLLGKGIELAAVNGPASCVLAGPLPDVARLEARLTGEGTSWRRLRTSHAFHTSVIDSAVPSLLALAERIGFAGPRFPFVSTVTGEWIRPEEAMSAAYWAQHARQPVRFGPALHTLTASGRKLLLEVGPGSTLSGLAAQSARGRFAAAIPSLGAAGEGLDPAEKAGVLAALGRLWTAGASPALEAVADAESRRIPLPSYPFERRRHWIDPPAQQTQAQPNITDEKTVDAHPETAPTPSATLRPAILAALEDVSGDSLADVPPQATFLEMGFDSLVLSRVAQQLQQRFGVPLTFRKLLAELDTLPALERFLLEQRLELAAPPTPVAAPKEIVPPVPALAGAATSGLAEVMQAQLAAMSELMRRQLEMLHQGGQGAAPIAALPTPTPTSAPTPTPAATKAPAPADERPSRFDAYARGGRKHAGLTPIQSAHLKKLTMRLLKKMPESKRRTAAYRSVLADPRAVAGFRAEWKELVFPIVCDRAADSRIWDVDGNVYIDVVNGYGPTAFGHSPDFVLAAMREQLEKGFAIGPQAELAGETAAMFCEMTGNDRMTFCNTGSEAVMAALRIARTVTGRSRVVMFNGDYHGQFDEVLVKSSRRSDGSLRSVPVAAGIPASAVENMVVLDYAAPESLDWIRQNAGTLAAVLVEPVQSRHPGLQPFEFLRELRAVTEANGIVFVMDEIVTGFRVHTGGVQALTGIRADLVTYGKVVGGGMPIGILAGKAAFMDALDGGAWQYGDDSVPEAGVTFFAGTFVRHPLAIAAVRAVLQHLRELTEETRAAVEARTARLADGLNAVFAQHGLKASAERFSSLLYFSLSEDDAILGLLPYHLRDRGIHYQSGFPIFLTTAHTDADIEAVLAAFADSLDELAADGAIASANRPLVLSPTESQLEIWLSAQMGEEASCAFNESVTLRLRGTLDEAALRSAVTRLFARHDGLRLRFAPTGERMIVAPAGPVTIERIDARGDQERLSAFIEREATTPFDLVAGPLARLCLATLAEDEHALVLTAHHIICDGWSINILITELAELYEALTAGREPRLGPVMAFSDYARAKGEKNEAALSFWRQNFATPEPPIDLPTDRPRPAVRSFRGATASRRIGPALHRAVKAAGAREGCTLFVTLLGAFQVLKARLAGTNSVVCGVPMAGQSKHEGTALVGHCVNFLPIAGSWTETTTMADHLRAVRQQVLDASENQDCTLGSIVQAVEPPRLPGRLPITELQFNLEQLADKLTAGALSITVEPNAKARVTFDLFYNVIESADGLRIDCDYNTDLFDRSSVEHWLACYEALLEAIAADVRRPAERMPLLSAADKDRILWAWNATQAPYPPPRTTLEAILARVAEMPEAPAVAAGGVMLTYRALMARAAGLAKRLQGSKAPVGVLAGRSADLVVALLGVWLAGRPYVPLDPAHPLARLRRALADAGVGELVIDASTRETAQGLEAATVALETVQAVEPPTSVALEAEATAYIIYTSGSTGLPKGVSVSHRSLLNLLSSIVRSPGIERGETLFALTTVAFDIAALELLAPLIAGGTVRIATAAAAGPELMAELTDSAATIVQATPSLWRLLLEAGFASRPGLRMLAGGEPLGRDLANRLLAGGGRLWNMYGPTETTIWSSCDEVLAGDGAITVGFPIANTQLHVLDGTGAPVPFGAVGELHIGGDGVAEGYVGKPELTAERFIPDPFAGSKRCYRTGDLARRLTDGRIKVLGRADQQVKLRGFRIELGEIEAALARQTGVAGCAVMLRTEQEGRALLVGYIAGQAELLPKSEALQAALRRELPDYMVPSAWVRLAQLPLTANGKLDRAALPELDLAESEPEPYAEPRSELEIKLAKIWAEVLHLERVGRDADLFRLGADSIHLFQIAVRANQQGISLRARELLLHRTVAAVAEAVSGGAAPQNNVARPSLAVWAQRRARAASEA